MINDVLVALYRSVGNVTESFGCASFRETDLLAIAQPIAPKRFPTRKKFLRPKMSLHRPAIVMATALASAHEVGAHAMVVDGPTSSLMVRRIADGRANANRHAS
jgi:hypothetical protein